MDNALSKSPKGISENIRVFLAIYASNRLYCFGLL